MHRVTLWILVVAVVLAGTAAAPAGSDLALAGAAVCNGEEATLTGTGGDDTLVGTPGRDVIVAGAGDDVIRGRGGPDLICAGGGADVIRGGSGDDVIFAGGGRDDVTGGSGADVLFGASGRDVMAGGRGVDIVNGGKGADELRGGGKGDQLLGKGGDDDLDGESGVDDCDGGGGFNTARCERYAGPAVTVDVVNFEFSDPEVAIAAGTSVVFSNVEGLHTAEAVDDAWASGDLNPGDSFAVTFDTPGQYAYFCYYHPWMTGTVTVGG